MNLDGDLRADGRRAGISVVFGLFLVFTAVLLAVGGLILVQWSVPSAIRREHNDVVGFIYAVLGVAYAVLLGLMVVAVWQDWEEAQSVATNEANELAAIFWLAGGLPEPRATRIQEDARSYARVVVEEEWPMMRQGKASPKAWHLMDEIRAGIRETEPSTSRQQAIYDQQLQRVHELSDAREERLLYAREGLPGILWAVLLTGGAIVVSFTYLFGLRSTLVHTLMVASLTLTLALVLFTVGALDYPFKGDVRVGPDAFESVLARFESSEPGL